MLQFTIEYFKDVPDSDILINRKDFPFLCSDNKYAYEHLIKGNDAIIKDIDRFYFLGSQSAKDINLDIPIPSADEWKDINNFKSLPKVAWVDKKSIAFFRGSGTGCGTNIKTNPRYLLADISYKWKNIPDRSNLLDAAISKLVSRIKVYDQFIGLDPIKEYRYLVGSFVNLDEQLHYKYIFNIQGNAQTYRYPNEFKKRSLILNVESEYKMWFESILIDNKHIINIKSDYSNLYDKLIYLKSNDQIAKKIAYNGYKFSKRYINKKMIETYWLYYMYNINKNTV
jgi:protein glucosyltransferase